MKSIQTILVVSLLAVSLAGCTGEDETRNTDNPTPATTVPPTASTPAATTPAPGQGSMPLVCDAPAASDMAAGEVMGYPEIVFSVKEPAENDSCFGFVGPESVEAGWTAVTLRNDGQMPHIMPMFRLADNRTFEEYLAASNQTPPPSWVVPVAGVGFATPGQNGTAIIDLQPGVHVVACFFEGHHTHGMVRAFNVTEAQGPGAAEPEADVTFTLVDYNFTIPENVTAGRQIVGFVNNGTEPHEAPLVRLVGNATAEEFLAAILNPQGPPPGLGVGGVNVFLPGEEAYAVVDLEPGNYALVCFVESHAHGGAPHVMLGMLGEFAVA